MKKTKTPNAPVVVWVQPHEVDTLRDWLAEGDRLGAVGIMGAAEGYSPMKYTLPVVLVPCRSAVEAAALAASIEDPDTHLMGRVEGRRMILVNGDLPVGAKVAVRVLP